MRHGRGYLLILATLIFSLCQASLIEYAKEIPPCGLTCLLQAIPASVCHTFTNETCICTDPALLEAVTVCASQKCEILDQIKFAKIQETACDKPQRRRSMVDEVVFCVLDVVTLICIIVRIFVRYHMTSTMEMDDWVVVLMVLVWAAFLGLGHYSTPPNPLTSNAKSVLFTLANVGSVAVRITALGRDIWDVEPETVTKVLRATFIDELFYTLVLSLSRIAVVMFLLRVFDVPRFRLLARAVIGWIVLYAAAVLAATTFQCVPIRYNWLGWTGQFAEPYRCIDVNALSFAAAGIGIAQDLAILVLPLPIILSLNMALRKRAQTVVMFSLGLLVVITSAVRLRYLVRFEKSDNPTWDNVDAIIWTHAEVSVSVIVVCLPTVRAALASAAPRLFGSTAKTPGGSSGKKMPSGGGATGSSTLSRRSRARRERYEGLGDDGGGGGLGTGTQGEGTFGVSRDDIELASSPIAVGRRSEGDEDEDQHKTDDVHHTFYHNNGSSDVILGNPIVAPRPAAVRNFSHPPGSRIIRPDNARR
ncbi:hypothetical protein PG991_014585 [Apiospora marii]|uniref:CFEM domain-containing protein n=1 Tax=Apiospora marii TaxID=335849 RepID=A0ABR1R3V3_9PEZI